MVICALGDLLLDVVIRLEGPVAEDEDTHGRSHVGAGGQAANVAAWATALGGQGRFVGKRAADPAGRLVVGELERRRVEILGPEEPSGTGAVVSIATPDGRRTTQPGLLPAARGGPSGTSYARAGGARLSLDVASTTAARQAGIDTFRAACRAFAPAVAATGATRPRTNEPAPPPQPPAQPVCSPHEPSKAGQGKSR